MLFAALLLGVAAGTQALSLHEHHIGVEGEGPRATAMRDLAWTCAEEVNGLLRVRESPEPVVTITIAEKASESGSDPFQLRFGPELSVPQATDAVVRALLLRHARVLQRGNVRPVENLDWLAAAVTNSVLFSGRQFLGWAAPDFQPARASFLAGEFPRISALFKLPVSPERQAAYRLYALHCHLLVLALQSASRPPNSTLYRMLELLAHGRDPVEAATFLLRDQFGAGEELQAWYERAALRVSRRGRRPSAAADVAQRLQELETVPMVTLGTANSGCVRVPIEEVPDKLKSYQLDRAAVRKLEHDCYELMKDAPPLLQKSLLDYVAAFQAFGDGSVHAFTRKLRRARKDFAEALKRQQAIEAYLESLEAEATPATDRFGLYLDAARRNERRCRDLDPMLHTYLDGLAP